MFLCIYICRHGILCDLRLSGKQLFPARSVKKIPPRQISGAAVLPPYARRALYCRSSYFSTLTPASLNNSRLKSSG